VWWRPGRPHPGPRETDQPRLETAPTDTRSVPPRTLGCAGRRPARRRQSRMQRHPGADEATRRPRRTMEGTVHRGGRCLPAARHTPGKPHERPLELRAAAQAPACTDRSEGEPRTDARQPRRESHAPCRCPRRRIEGHEGEALVEPSQGSSAKGRASKAPHPRHPPAEGEGQGGPAEKATDPHPSARLHRKVGSVRDRPRPSAHVNRSIRSRPPLETRP